MCVHIYTLKLWTPKVYICIHIYTPNYHTCSCAATWAFKSEISPSLHPIVAACCWARCFSATIWASKSCCASAATFLSSSNPICFLKAHKQQSAPPIASSMHSFPWLQHLFSSNLIRIKTNNKNHFQRHIFSAALYASNSVFAVAATSLLLKSYSYEEKQQKAPRATRGLWR